MIYNEEAYYTGYYRNVRELGAIQALVFDTIAGLLRATDGIGEISNSTLMELLGIKSKSNLWKIINELIAVGYIEKKTGNGRGNISIYYITEKGSQNIPFMAKKGSQNDKKGFSKVNKRVLNSYPLNKELNKELKESDDDMRETHTPSLSNTTPQNFENMEDFNLWFELFTGGSEWQHERENCERVWYGMTQQWRDNLVQMAQNGLRWRKRENDNPYWYLKNYNGEFAQVELPYFRQGTKKFEDWWNRNIATGTKMILMRYREPGASENDPTLAHCLATDKQIMLDAGAEYIRDLN